MRVCAAGTRKGTINTASKVIQTVLKLRDDMSKGLLGAAKNAKKAGASINNDMMAATRKVVAFKNKTVSALTDTAKAAVKWSAATGAAMAGGFLAMAGATEEYRVAQGKLNTAFEAAGLSAEAAKKAYSGFYDILGDTDTATEASQLLAKLTRNAEDVSRWTRIAAGVSGTFGDSLPIEGLIESTNETSKVGKVTGVLADALNWAGISEDDFNTKLAGCASEIDRNRLLMTTLSDTYNSAADAFYKNNKQVVTARANQRVLMAVTAKLGETSAGLKNSLAGMFGFDGAGGIRAGSILDFVSQKAEALNAKLQQWQQSGVFDVLAQKLDSDFAWAVEKAGNAMQFLQDNADKLIPVLKGAVAVFAVTKITGFVSGIGEAAKTVSDFTAMLGVLAKSNGFAGLGNALGAISNPLKALQDSVTKTGIRLWSALMPEKGETLIAAFGKRITSIPGQIKSSFAKLPDTLSAAWDGLKIGASDASAVIKAIPDKLGSAFGGFRSKLAGVFNLDFLKAAPKKLLGAFKGLPGKLARILGNPTAWGFAGIIAAVAGVVAAGVLLYRNWDTVKAKATELAAQFKTNFAPAIETAKNVASQLASFFTGTVVPAAQSLWNTVKQLAVSFVQAMAPAASVVLGIVSKLAAFFVNSVVPAIVSIIQFVGQLASAFLTIAAPAVNAVVSIAKLLANIFSAVVAPAIGAVSAVISVLAKFFMSKVLPAVQAVLDIVKRLADFLAGALSKAVQSARDWFQKFSTFLSDTFGPVIDAIKRAFEKVKTSVEGVVGKVKEFLGMNTTKTVTVNTVYNDSGGGNISGGRSTGHNASGTRFWRGGLTWVNERGGEIIRFPDASQIIPKDIQAVRAMAKSPEAIKPVSNVKKQFSADNPVTRIVDGSKRLIRFPAIVKAMPQTVKKPVNKTITKLMRGEKTLVNLPRGTEIIPHERSKKLVGHNALGTSYWRGGLTEVNERGGEIIRLPGQKPIVPNDVPASSKNVTINLHVDTMIGDKRWTDYFSERVSEKIMEAIENAV